MFLVAILAAVVALVITGHTAWAIAVGIVGGVITLGPERLSTLGKTACGA